MARLSNIRHAIRRPRPNVVRESSGMRSYAAARYGGMMKKRYNILLDDAQR